MTAKNPGEARANRAACVLLRSLLAATALGLAAPATAQIAYLGAGTASNTAAYASSVTPTLPAGWSQGDLLVIVAHFYGLAGVTIQTPAGYTQIGSNTASATYGTLAVFYKLAGVSETDPTVSNTPTTSGKFTARVFAFGGIDPTTPIDVAGSIVDQAAALTWTGSQVTTTRDDAMVIFAGGSRDDNSWGNWGGAIDQGVSTPNATSTNDNSIFLGYHSTPAGTTAGLQAAPSAAQTALGGATGDAGRHITFALRPPPPVAPSAPGTPTLGSVGSTTVTATWTASATGTPAPTYTVQKSPAGAGTWSELTGCVGLSALTCNGSGLAANTNYDFRVVATNSAGSATSGTATQLTLPGQPVMAAYTNVEQTTLTVNWTMSGATTGVTYGVERAPDSSGIPGTFAPLAACQNLSVTTCNDTGLTASTPYWYQVTATNTAGGTTATPSTVTTKPPPPPTPGIPGASAQTTTSMTVGWTPSTGATSYTLQVSRDDTFAAGSLHGTYTPATNSQSVTGLSSNTIYWLRVSATGTGGTSDWSPAGTGTTRPDAPGQPGFSGTTSSGTTVSWAAPTGNATITSYSLDRATNASFTLNLVTTNGIAGTSTPVSGLAASTTYWFRVRAVNAAGTSIESTPNSVATSGAARTLLATGSDPAPTAGAPLCPGGEAAYVGQFVFSSDPSADTVNSLDVALGAGASPAVALVELRDATGTSLSPPRSEVPAGDTVTFGSALLPSPTGAGATYRIYVTPQLHSLTAAGSYGVTARVSSFTPATHPAQGTDSASTFTVDNEALANGIWGAVTPGSNQVSLAWTNPAADAGSAVSHVVILRRTTGAVFTETLDDGATPPGQGTATGGGSYVVHSQAGAAGAPGSVVDTNVLNGSSYVYRLYVRDACGNWNAGVPSGPHLPTSGSFVAEGSTVPGAPMISIVNPLKGSTVSGSPFRVQIRVFNAAAQGGIAGTSGLAYSTDDGATWQTSGITTLPGGTATGQTYEVQLSPAAGGHTLRAKVSNGLPVTVLSNSVPIMYRLSGGAGTLLVRDNSSQLCSDCHAVKGHTSETTASARGSWSTTCRDCHTPHGTKNIALVAEQITPPALTAPQAPKPVVFYEKGGYAASSYASAGATGPCQVCHTRTTYFQATISGDGSREDHNPTSPCASCHTHGKGFQVVCTDCHGTAGRLKDGSVAGAVDGRLEASPPRDADSDPTNDAVRVGAHLAHVNKGTYRRNALGCADCHPWPNAHQKPSQRDAGWSALASTTGERAYTLAPAAGVGAYSAAWELAPSCTNWCHGAGLGAGGGGVASWSWTAAGPLGCTSCHASPPPVDGSAAGDHPQNAACASCHGGDYAQASIGATSKTTHVDGTIQKPLNGCTACHGKLAGPAPAVALGSAAPESAPGYDSLSVDTHGGTDSTVPRPVGVGAHGKHVRAGMMTAKACIVCHPHPTDGDRSHASGGAAEMQWSSPANVAATPLYASPTCTNYCHSTGDPMGAATPTRTPVVWTSVTPMDCTSCHASTTLATNAHGAHVPKYACNLCHVDTTPNGTGIVLGGGLHVNGANDVAFDVTSPLGYLGTGSGYATAQCSNTYCHSNGTDRNPPYTSGPSIAWNTTATCTSCHGGPQTSGTPIATGRHPNHVNVAGTIGGAASTNFECGTCHATTVDPATNAPVTTAANHVDRNPSVSFDAFYGGTFTGGAEGAGSCASNYCHSSGQDPAAAPAIIQYKTIAWNAAALGCNGCHGAETGAGTFVAVAGEPNYASGGEGAPTANSHQKHVTAATQCAFCHAGTAAAAGGAILATSALHLDKGRQVQIDGAHDGDGAATNNYTAATKTCNNVTCHGPTGTPRWGGPPLKCSDCHAGPTDQDSFAFGTAGVISTDEWTARGHGQATFGANTFPTLAAGTPCLYCHDVSVLHDQTGNPYRLRGATGAGGAVSPGNYSAATASSANQVCLNCHATAGANGVDLADGGPLGTNPLLTSVKKIDAHHAGADHGARNGGTRCWDCHDPHGDGNNLDMVGSKVVQTSTDNHSWAATRVTGVAFTANATGTDYANATATSLCRACHVTAAHYNAATSDGHNAGSRCIACHAHNQAPNLAFRESSGCNACHGAPPTPGKHAFHDETTFAETSYTNAARHASATQYGFACNTCHAGTHMNGTGPYTAQVVFGSFDAVAVGGSYAAGAAQPADTAPTGMLTFNWSNGTCNATYCHSNAAPVGGTNLAAGPTWNETAWVKTGPTANECTKCHQVTADNPASAGSTKLSHSHWVHVTTNAGGGYYYGCAQCHNGVATGQSDYPATAASIANKTLHVNGAHTVAFDAAQNPGTTGYNQAPAYTCTNTYCHSNGTNAATPPANTSIAWNSAGSTCASCHPDAATLATGKHANHVNNAALLGTSYFCGDCHKNTVAGGTSAPVTSRPTHVNRVKDVSIANRGTFASTDTTTTCSSTYCHSNGQRQFATKLTVTWADAAWAAGTACYRCHGTTTTTGAPDYGGSGTANSATANSHAAHATSSATCATCHNGFVTTAGTAISGSSHTNGVINVAFDAAAAGTVTFVAGTFTSPSTYTSATCANVKCHGNNAAPVAWGSTLDCTGCHMGATGTADAEVDNYAYNDGTFAKIDPEDWINYGHGRPTASGAYDSGSGAAGFDTDVAVSGDDGCKYCHDETVPHGAFGTSGNPFRLANIADGADAGTVAGDAISEKVGVCTVCHGGSGYTPPGGTLKTAAKAIDANHYGSKHGGSNGKGGELCWDCHDPHGDSRYMTNAAETPVVGANELLGYMIDAKLVQSRATSAAGSATEWGQTATYAASAPRFLKARVAPATSYDWGDYVVSTTPFNGVCQACHSATVHYKNSAWTTTIPSHADADSNHNTTGGRCTKCHAHDQVPNDAFRASCTGCHGNKGTPRTPVTVNADPMLDYAPPTAADGTTAATTDSHVGAHQSHVNQITLRTDPLLCSQCHGASLPVHPGTGTANIGWGTLATTGPVTPSYVRGTGCSLTYCHGNFKNGNDQITFTTPAAPTNLVFSLVTNTSLTLGWSGARGAVLYKVERAPDASGVPGTFVQIGITSTTSYADGGLFDGTTYWYRVRAWNPSGDGAYSANARQRTTGGLALTEFDLVGVGTTGTAVDGGTTNVFTATTALTPTTGTTFTNKNITSPDFAYADTTRRRISLGTNMTAATTYNYIDLYSPALTASNRTIGASVQVSIDLYMLGTGTGNGTWTATLYENAGTTNTQQGTPCTAAYAANVTTFQTVACTFNNAQWTAALNSRIKVRLQIIVPTSAAWGRPALLWGANRVTSGTMAGQTYFTASIGTPATPPAAASGAPTLTLGTPTETTVPLSWTTVTNATSYIVERGDGATPATWAQVGQPTGLTFTDQGLTANTTYTYRVRGTNVTGAGTDSGNRTATTAPVPSGATAWAGTFTPGSTTLTCASCHGNPPGGTHGTQGSMSNCSACHTNYGNAGAVPQAVDKARHINGIIEYDGDCISCHTMTLDTRRNVVGEFAMKWSHKRSAGGTVTVWDCVVCHMEGDPATGGPSGVHMDGNVNLRDPDTGNQIQNVTWTAALGGTAAGSFGPGTGDATFTQFSRNLAVPFELDGNFLKLAAIQINHCMKCHDGNGATAFNTTLAGMATNRPAGVTRSAAIPFGTAISYSAVPANEGGTATVPTGALTAGGVGGGVIRLDTSFATTNSSYHPVLGRNNNAFVFGLRAWAPWDGAIPNRTQGTGSNTSYGYLISCWDCHAANGTPSTATLTSTVTAHGGATTVRGSPTVPNGTVVAAAGTNEATLCKVCHKGYYECTSQSHCANSAMNTAGQSPMSTYMRYGCNICHASDYGSLINGTYVIRPVRAQDTHGVDVLPGAGVTKTVRWATANAKPYAFIRNTRSLSDHSPILTGYTINCNMADASTTGTCQQGSRTYSPGGVY